MAGDASGGDTTLSEGGFRMTTGPAGGTAPQFGPPVAVVTAGDERVAVGLDEEVTFGRADDVRLRIGHEPLEDDLVAPVAGALLVCCERVVVANRGPRLAFDVAVPGRALLSLPPLEWHAPAAAAFTIIVHGVLTYALRVESAREPVPDLSPSHGRASGPTAQPDPDGAIAGLPVLTSRQRVILNAYVAPMAEGLRAATHQDVAEALGVCRQTVRLECAAIHKAFLDAGVPMRDWRDSRDVITDAWARHCL